MALHILPIFKYKWLSGTAQECVSLSRSGMQGLVQIHEDKSPIWNEGMFSPQGSSSFPITVKFCRKSEGKILLVNTQEVCPR